MIGKEVLIMKKAILLLTVSCMLTSCSSQMHMKEDVQGMASPAVAAPAAAVLETASPAVATPAAAVPETVSPAVTALAAAATNPWNETFVDFSQGASPYFTASDGWSNGSVFNCTWRAGNISFVDSVMRLSIDTDVAASPPYSGGEYRSVDFYGYGKYEVSMKPIKHDGVVSSFFIYTGPYDSNPWDEIDIEFVGKDTTRVQFNYYTDGNGSHEYYHDLGFDASESFHTYGFDWAEGSITWYVDGAAVYTAAENIPATPGRVMMNVWPGIGVDDWLNPFDGTVPLYAQYQWVRITVPG